MWAVLHLRNVRGFAWNHRRVCRIYGEGLTIEADFSLPSERLTDARVRQKLEQAVEAAIEALNAFEGDCDLEPNGDYEPNTGDDEYYTGGRNDLEIDAVDHGDMSWLEKLDQTPQPVGGAISSTLIA